MSDDPDAAASSLRKLLDWREAHVDFDAAVEGLPPELRGCMPAGLPYSPWELLEHLRITQHDILDFSRNPQYQEIAGRRTTGPTPPPRRTRTRGTAASPPSAPTARRCRRWRATSGRAVREDPPRQGQTYMRELLLVADHTAYHIGEMVAVRRMLGAWTKVT